MNYSRRQLYAAGEPLGDSATEKKPGGGCLCGGGGGGSSSSSSNSTTTENTDKRIAVQSGMGISSDSSTINVQALDANIVGNAMDMIKAADATHGVSTTALLQTAGDVFGGNAQSFMALLSVADKLFTGAADVIAKTQDTALGQMATVNTSKNDSQGMIDQKTMVILAVAGIGALAMLKKG